MFSQERLEAFWNKIEQTEGCWLWKGHTAGNNRGSFTVNGRRHTPSEVMLMLQGQFRQGGLMILHSCDNKACVNPAHLRWGTQSDNMKDRSERHPGWAKKLLTPEGKPRWYYENTLAARRARGE